MKTLSEGPTLALTSPPPQPLRSLLPPVQIPESHLDLSLAFPFLTIARRAALGAASGFGPEDGNGYPSVRKHESPLRIESSPRQAIPENAHDAQSTIASSALHQSLVVS